jgi:hypothetical protein
VTSKFRAPEKLYEFHIENPEIFGSIVQNILAKASWRQGFVHPFVARICRLKERVFE